ncbi:MAG TPA: hypothetical protein VGY56_18340 [Verrucomicrobiae bacterium]|nr:hypothetical protein [Verrucomicrobiae bacterium]
MKIKWIRFDSVNVVAPPGVTIPNFKPCIGPGAGIQAGQMKVRGDDVVEIDAAGMREHPKDRFWFTDTRGITYLSVPGELFIQLKSKES